MNRILLSLTVILLCGHARTQVAIGVFGGGSEDRIWQTELTHLGVLFEFRSKVVPSAGIRTSIWYTPERSDYSESYHSVQEPVERTWLALTNTERMSLVGAAIDLKFPFEHNACLDGYYKGTYLLAGLGYAQRWRTIDIWEQDKYGTITTSHMQEEISEPMLRAGFGGEWNFRWGGPYIEGLVTISAPGMGQPAIRFPGAAVLSVGYRYSFGRSEPMIEGE